jgi:hypothetical protein
VRTCIDRGERVLIALSPAATNPTSTAIAKSTDAAVLCVLLERMRTTDAKQTVQLIGQSKFVGSVIIRPNASGNGA